MPKVLEPETETEETEEESNDNLTPFLVKVDSRVLAVFRTTVSLLKVKQREALEPLMREFCRQNRQVVEEQLSL